jgi:hypothetical protein
MTQRRRQSKREFTLSSIFLSMFETAFHAEIRKRAQVIARLRCERWPNAIAAHAGNQDSVITSDA